MWFFHRPLREIHPFFYHLRIHQRRAARFLSWFFSRRHFARERSPEKLAYRCFKHTSKLIKALGGTEMEWQYNKVKNIALVVKRIDGVLLYPGQTFSFWRLVGRPDARKGYLAGMEIANGKARAGIGGGICQVSNLIHWMALHTPLTVVERSNHSFDPFPDEGRILPFGSGAAVFYNFIDLIIANPTANTYQINLWMTDHSLEGDIRSNGEPRYRYHVFEQDSAFIRQGDHLYRCNTIARDVRLRGKEAIFQSETLYHNHARVQYDRPEIR